jgi:glycosyltransferase involved in cell wall biosynthesis
MASGLPVIASAVNGSVEVLEDSQSGVLVPPKDVDALARAIESLIESPEERRRLGHAAPARAAREFSVESMVDGYRRVYERVLGGSRS